MDHIAAAAAAAEEQIVKERVRQKLNQINSAAQTQLSSVQDHVNFTLQQAHYKCAYECFDRSRRHEDIGRCVENCSAPLTAALHLVEAEMAKFQGRLNRSLLVCQDKYDWAKLQKITTHATNNLESCVDQSVQDGINTLPHLVRRLKTSLSIGD